MRSTILGFGLCGMLLFGAAFLLSFARPLAVERIAREAVRIQVERETGARIDALTGGRLAGMAHGVLKGIDTQGMRTWRAMRADLPHRVAEVTAGMLDADCPCRRRLGTFAGVLAQGRLFRLGLAHARLTGLIESRYAAVRGRLLRECRIFTGANAAAFALLAGVTLARRRAGLQLVLPAAVLAGALAIAGGFYLFGQDWLHTLIFNDYVGLAYAGWLAAVALLLADIALNGARVTTRAVNAVLHAAGSTVSALPC